MTGRFGAALCYTAHPAATRSLGQP